MNVGKSDCVYCLMFRKVFADLCKECVQVNDKSEISGKIQHNAEKDTGLIGVPVRPEHYRELKTFCKAPQGDKSFLNCNCARHFIFLSSMHFANTDLKWWRPVSQMIVTHILQIHL